METITKHPEWGTAIKKYLDNFKGMKDSTETCTQRFTYGAAEGAFINGAHAAQAILQPEINRLRESNAELIKRLEELQNAVIDKIPDSMPVAKEIYNASQVLQWAKAIELAEGPNK